ncbi:hypothetical protein GCM10010136_18550 [Limoniibacter endophyticus]|uniref:Uncharacterized protein n=2 Tax=Limoniibacter endophyticus TaxID=1565040 RepID=A0A8J3DNN1_9HYPH|nr:hypothetical protein GCM10010136_18550 [Limoniibacter endophyticus]
MTGYAVDLSRIQNVRTSLQDQADAAAIAIAKRGKSASLAEPVEFARNTILAELGPDTLDPSLELRANWDGTTDVEVFVNGKVEGTLMRIVPGISPQTDIGIYSRARVEYANTEFKPPKYSFVDPEADHYNRIYFYCYYPDDIDTSDPSLPGYDYNKGRDQLTPVSDNAEPPTAYPVAVPDCGEDGNLSFKREQMDGKYKKNPPPPASDFSGTAYGPGDDFIHKADGAFDRRGDRFNPETIRCRTEQQCKPKSQGGVIPEGKNRFPVREDGACPVGEFRYFGWEDGNDDDFNDITIIMECPTRTAGDKISRIYLVK